MENKFFIILIFLPSGFCIASLSQTGIKDFEKAILRIRNDVLKVAQYQKLVDESVQFQTNETDSVALLQDLTHLVRFKFLERINAVIQLQDVVKKTYIEKSWGHWMNCCLLNEQLLSYDSNYKAKVDLLSSCSVAAASAIDTNEAPDVSFLKVAKANSEKISGLKWQYFGSDSGVLTQYPATKFCTSDYGRNGSSDKGDGYDNRFRPWYVQASAPKPKDVVLVIDRSSSMRKFDRMLATKNAAVTVLNTLTPDDRIAVITFSDKAFALGTQSSELTVSSKNFNPSSFDESTNNSCFDHEMASATPLNIQLLTAMIHKIVPAGETYYANALRIAFDFHQNAFKKDREQQISKTILEVSQLRERVILFLSDGEPTDLPYKIFKTIRDRNRDMYNSVKLLCFALGRSTFGSALQRMAKQNFTFQKEAFTTVCQENCDLPTSPRGMFKHVKETKNLRTAMGFYYNFFFTHKTSSDESSVVWSVPYYDAGGLGMVITAASAVVVEGKLVGVVGVDLLLDELLADAALFRAAGDVAFTFLLDLTGRVVMHPFMPNPATFMSSPIITDFAAFEREIHVQEFLRETLHLISSNIGPTGDELQTSDIFEKEFNTIRLHPTVHKGILMYQSVSRYACSAITSTNFVLCLVVERNISSVSMLDARSAPENFRFVYHKFNSSFTNHLCNRQDQAITTDYSTVMLSPAAFQDSGRYAHTKETTAMINNYEQYIRTGHYEKGTKAIFKDDVRSAVLLSWPLEAMWKHDAGLPSVIWRYFGTEQGVFRIYPGVQMSKLYDPLTRPWYEMANALLWEYLSDHMTQVSSMSDISGTAISPPYVDANGAGLILTISSAVLMPRDEFSGEIPYKVFGVMGADLHLRDFDQYLTSSFPECDKKMSWSCIAIDTSGYVICDKHLVAKKERAVTLAASSNYHIIHAHSGVAHALITNKILVHEKCIDISTASYKTTYHIDVVRINQVVNLPFRISHIPSTNVVVIALSDYFNPSPVCIAHNFANDECRKAAVADLFTRQCESPCIDSNSPVVHYSRCLNLYNYTWTADPPPCQPKEINSDFSADENAQKIDSSTLIRCFSNSHAEALHQPTTKSDELSRSFIAYLVGCCLLLLAVWAGLNRRRIRNYCS